MDWRDSRSDRLAFFSTPTGRLLKFPLVAIAYLVLWAGVLAFLILSVENMRATLVVFLPYAFGLFVWTIVAIYVSFLLHSKVVRAVMPSIRISGDSFVLEHEGESATVPFGSVARVTVTQGSGRAPWDAAFDFQTGRLVLPLFDRSGFVAACKSIPALQYLVVQKLGAGNP